MEKLYRNQEEITKTQYISQNKTLPSISFICYDELNDLIDFDSATVSFTWKKFDPDLDIFVDLTPEGTINKGADGDLSYIFDVHEMLKA